MWSERLARNHFQMVVRASKGLSFLTNSRKFNDTDLRYRVTNMSTIPYIRVVVAHFKSSVGGVKETTPTADLKSAPTKGGLSLNFLETSNLCC